MATVDSLDIKIAASAERAEKALDSLIGKLSKLDKSLNFDTSGLEKLGSINGNNFKKLGKGMQSFASAAKAVQSVDDKSFNKLAKGIGKLASIDPAKLEALGKIDANSLRALGYGVKSLSAGVQSLKGVKKTDFNRLASGVERLANIQPGNLQAIANSLVPLAKGVRILGSTNFDNKNLQNLINSLVRLSNANVSGLSNVNFAQLGDSIKKFSNAVSGAREVPRSVINLTNAVAKLAQAGGNIGMVASSLPKLAKALKKFINSISKARSVSAETISFTQAIASLATVGDKAGKTASNLDALGKKLKKLFFTMSTAPAVSGSTIRMTQALAQLAGAGGRVGISMGSSGKYLRSFGNTASKSSKHVSNLAGQFGRLYLKIKALIQVLKSFGKSIESAMDYVETLNYFNAAFRQVAENADLSGWEEAGYESAEIYADSFKERAKQLTKKLTGFEVSDTGELTRTSTPSLGLDPDKTMQYQATFAQMSSSMGATSDAALKMSNALTMIGADLASVRNMKFEKVWEDMASGLAGMSRTLDKYGVNIRNVNLQQKLYDLGIQESIANLNQQDKAILRTIILLNSTKYAWGDLSRTLNQPSNQVRLLIANFQSLSRTIGSLFIPTITKVLPYINALVIALQRLFAWIGKMLGIKLSDFTASMGGISDSASGLLDMEDDAGDAASSIDGVTDSAKKLDKALSVLSFDELNQLSGAAQDADIDGGAADIKTPNIDYSDILGKALDDAMSEYQKAWDKAFAEMSNKANEIADKIVKAVKSAWERADFSDIGAMLGTSIKDGLDKIPWNKIQSAAAKIGKSIATFINGAVEVAGLGYSIGNTIAQALNTVLTGIDSFAKNLHWESVGAFIGDGINGALENINWKTALSASKNLGRGIGRAINSFLSRTDFGLVGKTVANAVNTAIQFALSLGTTIDFKLFGSKLADAINSFFKTFKADKVAKAVNVWIKGALKTATTLLKKTDFEMIGQKIGQMVAGLDLLDMMKGLASALWEAIKGAFKLLSGMFQSAPIESSLIAAFAVLKFTGVGKSVAARIALAIGGSIESAMQSSGFAANLQSGITKATAGAVVAFAEFSAIKGSVERLTEGVSGFTDEIGKIAGAVAIAGTAMTAVFGFPAGLVAMALVGVTGAFAGVISANDELAQKLKEEEEISRYGQTISDMADEIDRSSQAIRDRIKASDEYIKTAGVGEMNMAKDLSEKYFALAGKQKKTNEETEEMKRLADLLIGAMPELSQYYNDQTGLLETTKDKIDELIQSRLEEIKLNAIEEQLTQAYKDQAEMLMELEKATQVMNDKQSEMNELKQKYDDALEKSTMLQRYEELGAEIQNCQGDTSELLEEQEKLEQKLTSGGTEPLPTFQSIQQEVEKSAQDLQDFQGDYDKVKKSFVEADQTATELQGSIDRWTEMYTTGMKDSAKEGIKAHNSALENDSSMRSAAYESAKKAAYDGGVAGAKEGWNNGKESVRNTIKDTLLIDSQRKNALKSEFSGYAAFSVKGYTEKMKELEGGAARATRDFADRGILSPFASKLEIRSPSRVFAGYGENIVAGLKNGIDDKADIARRSIETLGGGLQKSMESSLKNIETSASTTTNNLSRSLSEAETDAENSANRISGIFSGVHIPLPHIGLEWDNWNFGDFSISIPKFKIDWYAKGGLFDKASVIGVGEAGREAVLPLENQRTMKMIADAILSGMGAGAQESPFLENIALNTQKTATWCEQILSLIGIQRGEIRDEGVRIREAINSTYALSREVNDSVICAINNIWEKLASGLNSGFSLLNASILKMPETMGTAVQSVISAINALPASINISSGSESKKSAKAPKTSKIKNISKLKITGGKSPNDIFKLATGGLVTAPIFAHMGEMSRPEAVLPLTNHRAMSEIAESIYSNAPAGSSIDKQILVEAFEEAIVTAMMNNSQNMGGAPEYIQNRIYLDRDLMARSVSVANNEMDYRMGVAPV